MARGITKLFACYRWWQSSSVNILIRLANFPGREGGFPRRLGVYVFITSELGIRYHGLVGGEGEGDCVNFPNVCVLLRTYLFWRCVYYWSTCYKAFRVGGGG